MVVSGALRKVAYSRSRTSCVTVFFWEGFASWPRSVDAAMRRMEFCVEMFSIDGDVAAGVVEVATLGSSL